MALTISEQLDKFVSSYVEHTKGEGLKIAYDSQHCSRPRSLSITLKRRYR